jgi:1-acyl-sn-glycerol-3-phosphate acyltransferase
MSSGGPSVRTAAAYYASWIVFGLGAVAFNVACVPLLLAPARERLAGGVRAAIRALFRTWVGWLRLVGLVQVRWENRPEPAPPRIFVANHPGLLDATFLLAGLPDAVTVFKPALLRNPLLGPGARIAGYGSGSDGVDLIRHLTGHLAAGRSVLIFPEGTRTTPGAMCDPLKGGFALLAQRAAVPIDILAVHASRDLLPRGGPWWRAPRAPIPYTIRWLGRIRATDSPVPAIVAEVRARLLENLSPASQRLPWAT